MLIIDGLRRIEAGGVFLPNYIRASMSLKSGTKVFFCVLPHRRTNFQNQVEMVVSPINFEHWGHLWKVRALFYDRPGVVFQFLTIVAERHFNICIHESSSIENRSKHMLELIIYHVGHTSEQEDAGNIAALRRRLIAGSIEDLVIDRNREAQLSIVPMQSLREAWKQFKLADQTANQPVESYSVIQEKRLSIPEPVVHRIRTCCGIDVEPGSPDDKLQVLLTADTSERILRGYFPRRDERMLLVRIGHRDQVGALARLTQALLSGQFDIIESLTRVQREGDRNHFDAVLSRKLGESTITEEQMRAQLEATLSSSVLKDLEPSIGYPRGIGSVEEGRRLFANGTPTPEFPQSEQETTNHLIRRKLQVLRNRLSRAGSRGYKAEELDQCRKNILQDVLAEDGGQNSSPLVFVSYDFSMTLHGAEIEQQLRRARYQVIDGKDPGGKPLFREVLIDRIRACDGFIGIWTLRRGGKDYSPWLLWELAVAQSFSIPVCLLVSSEFPQEVYMRVLPEKHHAKFDDANFLGCSKMVINWLQKDILESRKRHGIPVLHANRHFCDL